MGDNAKVKNWKKVPLRSSIHIRVLHKDYGWKVSDIWRQKYPTLPRQTVAYHAKKDPADETEDLRKKNPGRPRKMSKADVRRLKRKITTLRQSDDPNFTAVKLQKSLRSVLRLHENHSSTIKTNWVPILEHTSDGNPNGRRSPQACRVLQEMPKTCR